MGLFSKASANKVFESSKFFQPGRFLVEINKVKHFAGQNGDTFVIETIVHGADSDHPLAPKVGEIAAHVWNLGGSAVKRDMGMSNWWMFTMAALGVEKKDDYSDDEWEEASAAIIDKDQLVGQMMRLDVFMKKTKADTDFTVHKWLREATEEDIAEFADAAE